MENFENMDWEAFPAPADSEAEMKKIRKSIQKRNWKIVLTSVILVIALLVGTIQFAVPALESKYWDPNEATVTNYRTDLCLTLHVYSELFSPFDRIYNVTPQKTGFAKYSLSISSQDVSRNMAQQYSTVELSKNTLSLPVDFMDYSFKNFFTESYKEKSAELSNRHARTILNQLPEYVRVYVCAAFPEDISLQAAAQINIDFLRTDRAQNSRMEWIAIRGCDSDQELYPLCGIIPDGYIFNPDVNETYTCLSMANKGLNRLNLDQHFKSLLQYSIDRLEEGRGIIPPSEQTTTEQDAEANEDYYQNVLDYVNENGVYAMGCYLTASPKTILQMLDYGMLSYVKIIDAWIGC